MLVAAGFDVPFVDEMHWYAIVLKQEHETDELQLG